MSMADRHPALRIAQLSLGMVLMVGSPVVGILPGPGGIFVFAAGLVLVLRNSRLAQRVFARTKRKQPKLGHAVDLAMRRGSARRRRARAKVAAGELTSPPSPPMRATDEVVSGAVPRAAVLHSDDISSN
ncbi:MAG: hypothetical protein M3R41_00895 [Pseudomonadota bacterium]|nr:hypothetical protein [Pseudomonadota bacterium]